LAPAFQRYAVWSEKQKSFLIDSIIRGFPVPELYMQETIDDLGSERHIVVDDQQRIRACLEFLEGAFALDPDDTPEYADFVFDELPADVRQRIFHYQFVVRLLPDVPQNELRAIFGRLNRNVVALNNQELRHATYWGSFIQQMERLADDSFWQRSTVFTANDVRRMLDVEFVSELAIAYLHGLQNKKDSLDEWYAVYEKRYEATEDVADAFRSTLGEIARILPDLNDTRWRKKSDFYSLFLVVASHVDSVPLTREGRGKARRRLLKLGEEADRFLRDPDAEVGRRARRYAAAVERAASDIAQRRARDEVLEQLLGPLFA
jgi:hypothetical protein